MVIYQYCCISNNVLKLLSIFSHYVQATTTTIVRSYATFLIRCCRQVILPTPVKVEKLSLLNYLLHRRSYNNRIMMVHLAMPILVILIKITIITFLQFSAVVTLTMRDLASPHTHVVVYFRWRIKDLGQIRTPLNFSSYAVHSPHLMAFTLPSDK